MISPVFVGPLLTFTLQNLIPANANSSCDAQGQPGRSQHATDHEVREGYFLFASRLYCEHVVFLLVEFSSTTFLFISSAARIAALATMSAASVSSPSTSPGPLSHKSSTLAACFRAASTSGFACGTASGSSLR